MFDINIDTNTEKSIEISIDKNGIENEKVNILNINSNNKYGINNNYMNNDNSDNNQNNENISSKQQDNYDNESMSSPVRSGTTYIPCFAFLST